MNSPKMRSIQLLSFIRHPNSHYTPYNDLFRHQGICRSPPRRYFSLTASHPFSLSTTVTSGHSRWSKIKHDKAKTDASRTKVRSQLARDIALASKTAGPDPRQNPRLATLLASAKKVGFSKSSCDTAIARGQGRSLSGGTLEPFTLELLHAPTGAALLVECVTDNKARTLQELRELLKGTGATEGSVEWMFTKKGRLIIRGTGSGTGPEELVGESQPRGQPEAVPQAGENEASRTDDLDEEFIMEAALAAGAADIEFDAGVAELLTEPNEMTGVAEKVEAALGRKVERGELVWVPNQDMVVEVEDGSVEGQQLSKVIEKLDDQDTVTAVWVNTR